MRNAIFAALPLLLPVLSVSTPSPRQGDPVLVEATVAAPADNVVLAWKGRSLPMKEAGGGRYIALIGVDLAEAPGKVPLAVAASRGTDVGRAEAELAVTERSFPVQELKLPKKLAEFDEPVLERIRSDAERLEKVFAAVSEPAWDGPFRPPVEDYRPVNFGARRIINGEPRAQHAAVDIHVPEGTPVTAIAAGTVAFAGEQFFGGRSVVLDHGGGLFSIYYHLREYDVVPGQRVEKGERIGAVGSTGRATGPHLHFGVRAPGGRIDPTRLFDQAFR